MAVLVAAALTTGCAGELADASDTAARIDNPSMRGEVLQKIAEAEWATGADVFFRQFLKRETDPLVRARILLGRAEGLLATKKN